MWGGGLEREGGREETCGARASSCLHCKDWLISIFWNRCFSRTCFHSVRADSSSGVLERIPVDVCSAFLYALDLLPPAKATRRIHNVEM